MSQAHPEMCWTWPVMEVNRSIMAKGKMDRMTIHIGDNGGHTVESHFKPMPSHSGKMGVEMAYSEPEQHIFGAGEKNQMMAHIGKHLGAGPAGGESDVPMSGSHNEEGMK
jgi:hypothetical protein